VAKSYWLPKEEVCTRKKASNTNYMLTQKGEPFVGAEVTRQAVAQLIVDIVSADDSRFIKKSLGVSESKTDWDKPSFY
jgi:hypothetical protein